MKTTALLILALVLLLPPTLRAADQPPDRMLAHDVYFTLHDRSPAACQQLVDACKKYLANHPGVVWFDAGVLAQEFQREVNDREFDVALHLRFKNKAAHDRYQSAPDHLQFIAENRDQWKTVRVFDSWVLATASPGEASAGKRPKQGKVGIGSSFKGPIGLQLYSLRDQFKEDVPGTLDRVQALGFKYVELAGTYGKSPEEFRAMLAARGLEPVAAHFPFERYKTDVEGIAKEAKTLGIDYAGCAWIPHEGAFDEQECREAASVFNAAGAALAKHGLKFFYHNHGYEFQPHGDGTLLDLLMAETNPKQVFFEMDLLWTLHPGQDPAKLLEKYAKRWVLMHLKDLKKGVEGDFSGHTDVRNDVALGTGQMDFPAVLKAAKKAKIKFYFIEDESPTVLDQIPQSLNFLEQVSW